MNPERDMTVHMIPIDQIRIVNDRERGQSKFRQIVANIANIGLKKPITVVRRPGPDGKLYDLVCGQGRLLSYGVLGLVEIPALIIEASPEELFLMSLAENLARRSRTSLEMAREILAMKERGHAVPDIARKVDLHPTYVLGIIRLLKQGEERLLVAVERRQIPLTLAMAIAKSSNQEVQKVLQEVYEKGDLKAVGRKSSGSGQKIS